MNEPTPIVEPDPLAAITALARDLSEAKARVSFLTNKVKEARRVLRAATRRAVSPARQAKPKVAPKPKPTESA